MQEFRRLSFVVSEARGTRIGGRLKALILTGKNKLAIDDFSMDEPLTPDDVRIQIKDVGICGSDVHYYLRKSPWFWATRPAE